MISLRSMSMAAATIALFAPLSANAAQPTGWYVGGDINMSMQEDADTSRNAVTNVIEYKTGWGVDGSVGYAWGNGIRTEGEVAYRDASVDHVTGPSSGTAGGAIHNWAFMGNVLYDIETGTRITPYIGGGIGAALVNADHMRRITGTELDSDRMAFAYQGIAGASLKLDGNWALTADYRYFATPDVKFKTAAGTRAETENASHNLMLGLRYTFAEAPAKATPAPAPAPVAAPAPAKAAAPAVPAVPQSYMVFFDFDKSVLTPEAQRIIASAAQDFKNGKYVRLVVTGHTDTMGTNKYNKKLSDRRASAVKAEFAKLGVPAKEVMAKGVGEDGLMVPTADQVREAQNRRAEIVLEK